VERSKRRIETGWNDMKEQSEPVFRKKIQKLKDAPAKLVNTLLTLPDGERVHPEGRQDHVRGDKPGARR
jgi:hypothetical protein